MAAPNFGVQIDLHNDDPGCRAPTLSMSCWTVTIDLQNTTAELALAADVDGAYDPIAFQDHFGWGLPPPERLRWSRGLAGHRVLQSRERPAQGPTTTHPR